MNLSVIVMVVNLFFGVIIGMYFWNLLRSQKGSRSAVDRESRKEMEKLTFVIRLPSLSNFVIRHNSELYTPFSTLPIVNKYEFPLASVPICAFGFTGRLGSPKLDMVVLLVEIL